jgi:hypothetical protein
MLIGAYISTWGPHIAGDNELTLGQNIYIYLNFYFNQLFKR